MVDIVDGTDLWVIANYRETQLPNIHEGDRVTLTAVRLDWPMLAGILAGCLFAYWWMHVRRFNYLLLLLFLLYDAPIRRELKQMPFWRTVRKETERDLKMEN